MIQYLLFNCDSSKTVEHNLELVHTIVSFPISFSPVFVSTIVPCLSDPDGVHGILMIRFLQLERVCVPVYSAGIGIQS